jgi:hypothetical protein
MSMSVLLCLTRGPNSLQGSNKIRVTWDGGSGRPKAIRQTRYSFAVEDDWSAAIIAGVSQMTEPSSTAHGRAGSRRAYGAVADVFPGNNRRDVRSNCEHGHSRVTSTAPPFMPLVPDAYAGFAVGTRLSFAGSNARANYFEGAAACPLWVISRKGRPEHLWSALTPITDE